MYVFICIVASRKKLGIQRMRNYIDINISPALDGIKCEEERNKCFNFI